MQLRLIQGVFANDFDLFSLVFTLVSLAPGGGKMRDTGYEVG